jgi:hypothetical protein
MKTIRAWQCFARFEAIAVSQTENILADSGARSVSRRRSFLESRHVCFNKTRQAKASAFQQPPPKLAPLLTVSMG